MARIQWMMGFADQAVVTAKRAMEAAQTSMRSFPICYAVSFGGLPVAMWTGNVEEERRLLDLLVVHAAGNQIMQQWAIYFTRLLKLRGGNEADALVAAFIASSAVASIVAPFADLPLDAEFAVPLPRAEPAEVRWNTSEVLRADAGLLLWHDAPGAAAAAETKLLRALEIARGQAALSWELRAAMSLARLWRPQGRTAEAGDLLAATYGKFTEGFGTGDLVSARSLMTGLQSD